MVSLVEPACAAEGPIDDAGSPFTSPAPVTQDPSLPAARTANGQTTGRATEPFDPNAPPRATTPIGPNLFVGGYASLAGDSLRDDRLSFPLGHADSTLTPIIAPAFAWNPSPYLELYVNPALTVPLAVEERDETSQRAAVNMDFAFLTLSHVVPGAKLQVGRQRFIDPKRWLFNEGMDAIRLGYHYDRLSVELSISQLNFVQRNLLRRDGPEHAETFVNYYAYADYHFGGKTQIGLFALYQDQQRLGMAQPIHVGLQSGGRLLHGLKYWIQAAMVRGTDRGTRLRGEAIDVGLIHVFRGSWEPSLTIGYAYGTGDRSPDDAIDTSFRQTGFQDNSDKFNGVARFKYYGEVLDPQLTNLMILTGGIGVRPFEKTSFDVVYHYYLQDHATPSLHGTAFSANPTGLSTHLGSEVDVVAGYQGIPHLQTRVIVGYFFPGSAFPETARDGAFLASILLRYNFY